MTRSNLTEETTGRVGDFHGYRVGNKALHVGYLPGRVQCCLYVLDHTGGGSTIRTLAFFPTQDKAVEALDLIDRIAGAVVA
jgi:hypothetical protein